MHISLSIVISATTPQLSTIAYACEADSTFTKAAQRLEPVRRLETAIASTLPILTAPCITQQAKTVDTKMWSYE